MRKIHVGEFGVPLRVCTVSPAPHLSNRPVEAVLSERQEVTGTLVRKRFLTAMPSVKRDDTDHGPRFAVSGTVYDHALRAFDPEATVPERDGPYAKELLSFEHPQQIVAAEMGSGDPGERKEWR